MSALFFVLKFLSVSSGSLGDLCLRGLDPWQLGGLDTLPGCVPDGTGQDWLLPRSPVRGFSFLTPPLEASWDLKSRGP